MTLADSPMTMPIKDQGRASGGKAQKNDGADKKGETEEAQSVAIAAAKEDDVTEATTARAEESVVDLKV